MGRPLLAAAAAGAVTQAEDAHCHWRSYAARYDDVRAAFGHDESKLREHYFSYGRSEGRTCHDEMEPFDFVQEHWVEIEAPRNGDVFAPGTLIETTARVHESTVPAYGNASHVSLSILVANVERTFFLRRGAALAGVDAFCGEHPPLEPQNCAKLKNTLESLVKQLQENEPKPVLCFVVSDGTNSTERCDANPHASFYVSKPGRYTISVTARGALGSAARGPRSARSVVAVNVGCPGPLIRRPRHGSIVSKTMEVELEEAACVSVNGVERCGTLLEFADLPSGRVAVRASTGECLTTISVDVHSTKREYERPLLITAASERYVQRRMLDNLVGSLHFWEPNVPIVVYDLGFSPESRFKVMNWQDVQLRDLAPAVQRVLNETPKHTLQASSYAFKMIVVEDALRTARSVLWIDANCEARRPLDEVFHHLQDKGHFLVEHPYRFPTTQFHHPAAVARLGCFIDDFARQHCATTFVGVVQGSWFATEVLPRLVECMRDSECVNPVGSSRDNHRQEQTALNAILCALDAPPDDICLASKSFRMTADFENDHDEMQPTRDETAWNGMYLYTRRDHAIKPYLRFLRTVDPVALEL
jgi:hypothetical protein